MCLEDYAMMTTTTTLVNSVSAGLDPRHATQVKAVEKPAAEEMKAEEQESKNTSTSRIAVGKSQMSLKMYQIHEAAKAGILRPMWLEMLNMDPDMPRMRDLLKRAVKNKEAARAAERAAEEARQSAKPERAVSEARQSAKPERAASEARQSARAERAASEARQSESAKAERTTSEARQSEKSSSS
jgi:hypothetical protein